MDKKLVSLKLHPAKFPRDGHNKGGPNSKYPITWNEMLGKIFHKLIHKYKEKVMNTLPRIRHEAYR